MLVGLAIFFYMFSNQLKSQTGWFGFIVNLLFYIPCLLIDFTKYLEKEFQTTTHVIYILFIIEIVLILLYIYLSTFVNYIVTKDNIPLLEKAAFLDNELIIANSEQLKFPQPIHKSVTTFTNPVYRTNYAFSMWIYLNPLAPSNAGYAKETTIFNYGEGKPKITYFNNTTDSKEKDKYIIYFTNSNGGIESSYEVRAPGQKWNYFVFNYTSARADLFLNGDLVKTFDFDSNNLPSYLATDNVTIGSKNGINGAICNIKYYTSPLSKSQIANSYNLLMNNNPPVNNL